jgi:hypothetical protein
MAAIAYLDIDQGSDFSAEIQLENDDGTPMNLSGFSVYSQFRKSYGSTIGYSLNPVVLNASQGTIKLSLSGVESSSIRPGRYLYDIEIINTLVQIKTRVLEGVVTISAEITKIP